MLETGIRLTVEEQVQVRNLIEELQGRLQGLDEAEVPMPQTASARVMNTVVERFEEMGWHVGAPAHNGRCPVITFS